MNKLFFLFLIFFMASCSAPDQKQEKIFQKPNVLLIMTDDQGWGDLAIHGNDSIYTPNLDRLSKEGVNFERFFVSPVVHQPEQVFLRVDITSGLELPG